VPRLVCPNIESRKIHGQNELISLMGGVLAIVRRPPRASAITAIYPLLNVVNNKIIMSVATDDAETLFQRGMQEFMAGRHAAAVSLLRRAAAMNHAKAQCVLGSMHRFGEGGLPVGLAKAVALYQQSADQDDAGAMLALANMHEVGEGGLAKDPAAAERLRARVREMAKGGDAEAREVLNMWAERGWGDYRDDDDSVASVEFAGVLSPSAALDAVFAAAHANGDVIDVGSP